MISKSDPLGEAAPVGAWGACSLRQAHRESKRGVRAGREPSARGERREAEIRTSGHSPPRPLIWNNKARHQLKHLTQRVHAIHSQDMHSAHSIPNNGPERCMAAESSQLVGRPIEPCEATRSRGYNVRRIDRAFNCPGCTHPSSWAAWPLRTLPLGIISLCAPPRSYLYMILEKRLKLTCAAAAAAAAAAA